MLFNYKTVTSAGEERTGVIEAVNEDAAVSSLQRRGLVIVSIAKDEKRSFFELDIGFLSHVKTKDIVILSRQISTLFDAQVPALRAFRLLASESTNHLLQGKLSEVADDIQGGSSISEAFNKHPSIFSDFYVNMVRAGEESGKLSDTFSYLADYLDRSYELTSKIRSALTYPVFIITVFFAVMIGLFTFIIPKLTDILTSSGQEIPVYTKIVIAISDFLVNYGLFALVVLIAVGFLLWRYHRENSIAFSSVILATPLVGGLLRKIYLARLADNMYTMLSSGIPMVRAIEITANVVGNQVFKKTLLDAADKIKSGDPVSKALSGNDQIPGMMLQMMRVGEESGELGNILKKIALFYKREVDTTVDTIISLIEPAMIVLLGLGVGTVLASVMIPIYNIAGSI